MLSISEFYRFQGIELLTGFHANDFRMAPNEMNVTMLIKATTCDIRARIIQTVGKPRNTDMPDLPRPFRGKSG